MKKFVLEKVTLCGLDMLGLAFDTTNPNTGIHKGIESLGYLLPQSVRGTIGDEIL